MSEPQTPKQASTSRNKTEWLLLYDKRCCCIFIHFFISSFWELFHFFPSIKESCHILLRLFKRLHPRRRLAANTYTATKTSGVDSPKLTFVTSKVLNITQRDRKRRRRQSGLFRYLSVYSHFQETASGIPIRFLQVFLQPSLTSKMLGMLYVCKNRQVD
jgi:hypothetical protein